MVCGVTQQVKRRKMNNNKKDMEKKSIIRDNKARRANSNQLEIGQKRVDEKQIRVKKGNL